MKKNETLKKNANKTIKENVNEVIGGEFFKCKTGFNYFLMRSNDSATPSKGKYTKTNKLPK